MPGYITKRSKSSYTVVVDLGRDPVTGKRRQLWRSVKGTKRAAETLLVQLLSQRDQGIDQPPGKITLADYLERWLADYGTTNLSPKSYRNYADVARRHLIPALGSVLLSKVRPQHIQSYYSKALQSGRLDGRGGLSPASVLRHHQIIHAALRQAVRWQLLDRNPADAVEPPRQRRLDMPVLSRAAVQLLIAAADQTPYGAIVHMAAMTGLRMGELLGLRWQDVDLEQALLHVQQTVHRVTGQAFLFREPKTSKSRRAVALPASTVGRLRQQRQRQLEERLALGPAYRDYGLVFATPIGTPIDASNLRRAWLRVVHEAGLSGLRFHDLRHVHASLLLQQGTHPKVVSERLGHSGIGITMNLYSHVMPVLQAEAAARLDEALQRTVSEFG